MNRFQSFEIVKADQMQPHTETKTKIKQLVCAWCYLTITRNPVAPKRFIPGIVIVVMFEEKVTVWFVLVAC